MRIHNPGFKPDIQYGVGVTFKEIILRLIQHNISVLTFMNRASYI
jgi:hypothetical protein